MAAEASRVAAKCSEGLIGTALGTECDHSSCKKVAELWCRSCKVTKYCTPACQKNAWKKHKTICKIAASGMDSIFSEANHLSVQKAYGKTRESACQILLNTHYALESLERFSKEKRSNLTREKAVAAIFQLTLIETLQEKFPPNADGLLSFSRSEIKKRMREFVAQFKETNRVNDTLVALSEIAAYIRDNYQEAYLVTFLKEFTGSQKRQIRALMDQQPRPVQN
ncbi:MAG: hypothetical protein S4CHLAM81_06130 [Chlamydiales bacterium]|nr:hypothetical protein [Chlamydiales bacterium]MCH9635397.1 hypothetical protein [Chlamydiales bacterium]